MESKQMYKTIDDYIKEINELYDQYFNHLDQYSEKVMQLNETFDLETTFKLQEKLSPGLIAGNYRNNPKYILIGLNPGYNENQHPKEEKMLRELGTDQFITNFFNNFADAGFTSKYYEKLCYLFAGLEGDLDCYFPNRSAKIRYLQDKLLTLELIPYRSTHFKNLFTKNYYVQCYIRERFKNIKDFIRLLNPEYIFFNGRHFKLLFDDNDWTSKVWDKRDNPKSKRFLEILIKEENGIKYVIFTKQLASQGTLFIRSQEMLYDIPALIKS